MDTNSKQALNPQPNDLPFELEIVELDDRLDMGIDLLSPGTVGLDTCCTPSNNCSCCC